MACSLERRIGSHQPEVTASTFNPAPLPLSVLGSIQVDRLCEALSGADDGLASRFLFAWPERPAFVGLADRRTPPTDEMLDRLRRIASRVRTVENPLRLTLEADAFMEFNVFCSKHHRDTQDYAGLGESWFGKGPAQVLRLAAALHLLTEHEGETWTFSTRISADTIRKSCGLWREYFLPHALAMFAVGGASEADRRLRRIVDWIRRKSINSFTQRDIYRNVFWETLRPEKVSGCLKRLEALGAVRPRQRIARAGRPSGSWEVNPKVAGGNCAQMV
jgi:hypothetical protein